MAEAIIPPLPAEPKKKEPADPFAGETPLPSQDDMWRDAYGKQGAKAEEDEFDYVIPSNAFDPEPPSYPDGRKVDIDAIRAKQVRSQFDKAAAPLLKALGLSFDKLARFGYDEGETDPFAVKLKSDMQKLTRSL